MTDEEIRWSRVGRAGARMVVALGLADELSRAVAALRLSTSQATIDAVLLRAELYDTARAERYDDE